jgi:hypothetical protein
MDVEEKKMRRYKKHKLIDMHRGIQKQAHFGQLEQITSQSMEEIKEALDEAQGNLKQLQVLQFGTSNKILLQPEIDEAKVIVTDLSKRLGVAKNLQRDAIQGMFRAQSEVSEIAQAGEEIKLLLPLQAFSKVVDIPLPSSDGNLFLWKQVPEEIRLFKWQEWWRLHPESHNKFVYDGKYVTFKQHTLPDFTIRPPEDDAAILPDLPPLKELLDIMPSLPEDVILDIDEDHEVLEKPSKKVPLLQGKYLPWIGGGVLLYLLMRKK